MKGPCRSPTTAPELCDNNVVPVRKLSHPGSRNGMGVTPVSVWLVIEHFSRAQVVLIYYQENVL